jgi:hypothetical protein
MTTPLLILAATAVWSVGLMLVVALCRSAAQGDQWKDDRSFERAVTGRAARAVNKAPRRRPASIA